MFILPQKYPGSQPCDLGGVTTALYFKLLTCIYWWLKKTPGLIGPWTYLWTHLYFAVSRTLPFQGFGCILVDLHILVLHLQFLPSTLITHHSCLQHSLIIIFTKSYLQLPLHF